MTEIPSGTLVKIEVALARIEERQISMQKDMVSLQREADHRHANIKMVIDSFVPRRELDGKFKEYADRADQLNKRVEDIEADRKKILWSIAASGASAIIGIGGLILKKLSLLGF